MLLNNYFVTIILALLLAIVLKLITSKFSSHVVEFHKGISNGGMPSTHTALISSITAALYLNRGFDELFFLGLVLTMIVASDAVKVRHNLGLQAEKLNTLLKKDKIPVVKGHNVSQVLVGVFIGILSALLVSLI